MFSLSEQTRLMVTFPCFSDFTAPQLAALLTPEYALFRDYAPDCIIHLQNEICQSMDVVLSGEVHIQHLDPQGHLLAVHTLLPGDMPGASLLFAGPAGYPMTLVAGRGARLLHLRKPLVLALCHQSPVFLEALLNRISRNALMLSGKVRSLAHGTLRDSLTEYLLQESRIQNRRDIRMGISKTQLAERLGVVRTSVSRELSRMQADGLISLQGRHITLRFLPETESAVK